MWCDNYAVCFKFKFRFEFVDLSSSYLYKTVTSLEEFMSKNDRMHIDNIIREKIWNMVPHLGAIFETI